MRWLLCVVALAGTVDLLSSGAYADPIVNTGAGSTYLEGGGFFVGFPLEDQSLAAQFTANRAYTVTSIEGWMAAEVPGVFAISLYRGNGLTPEGAPIFTSEVRSDPTPNLATVWRGATDLNWFIGPATYWVAFEAIPGSESFVVMPSSSPDPLGHEAARNSHTGFEWENADGLAIGIRIFGDPLSQPAPVPEPSSLFLVGASALGVMAKVKRVGKRAVTRWKRFMRGRV